MRRVASICTCSSAKPCHPLNDRVLHSCGRADIGMASKYELYTTYHVFMTDVQVGTKPKGAENAEEVRILEGSGVNIQPCWTTEAGKKVEGCRVTFQVCG